MTGSGPRRRVAINFLASLVTQGTNKLFPLIAYSYAQKRLGTEVFGHAIFAITLVDQASPFIEAGTATYGQIVVGDNRGEADATSRLMGTLLVLRTVNALLAAAALAVWVGGWHPDYLATTSAISFMLVTTVVDMAYVQTGTQRIWALSGLNLVSKLAVLAGLFGLVRGPADATIFAVLLVATNSLLSIGTMVDSVRRWRPKWPSARTVLKTYRLILPFAVMIVLYSFVEKFDQYLVNSYLSPLDLGLYGGVNRIYVSLSALIPAIALAFGAEMLSLKDHEAFARHAEAALLAVGVVMLPVLVGAFFAAGGILTMIYDASYQAAALPFALLCLAFIPQAIYIVIGLQALAVRGHLKELIGAIAAGLAAGVLFGMWAVPHYGLVGAALAVVLCKVVLAALMLPKGASLVRLPRVARMVLPSVAAALLMGAALYVLGPMPVLPTLVWGGAVYGAASVVLQGRTLRRLWKERRAV